MKFYNRKTGKEIGPLAALELLAMSFDMTGKKANACRVRKMVGLLKKLPALTDADLDMVKQVLTASAPDAIEVR